MNASELFVQCLENEGVEYIFGVPGEENLDFLEALSHSSIRFVLTRHEQAAGFMAATYGRLTGKAGVCLSTLGPGATNFMTSAAYAQLGAMPMVVLTGQKPILESKQGRFQILDVVGMMKPVTKYAIQVAHGERIPAIVCEAFRQAQSERPGATHIELPEDIAAQTVSVSPISSHHPRRAAGEEEAVSQAVSMISQARHPLILVGAGANRKQITKMLTKLIDKTGIPFFNTQMGKGVVSEDHPKCLGTAALSDNDYVHCAVSYADLIINVGHDVIEKPPFFMKEGGTKVLHIDFDPATIDEVYFPHLEVVGDVANVLWQISEQLDAKKSSWDFSYYDRVKMFVDEKVSEMSEDCSFPVKPQRYVSDIRSVMGDRDIVTLDNGMYKIWFARNYRARCANTLLLDNALATMGAGLPSAIAAKIVYPERNVLAVCGDGGFMMNSQELETAVRMNLDLVVLVLNNQSYGMIKWKQENMHFADFGLDFANPDFVQYAQSYGAYGVRLEKTEDLRSVLQNAFSQGGVHLIDVPVDDNEHHRVLTEELETKICIP